MKYRKLDGDGDYCCGHSLSADFHIDTPEAVAQAVLTRLRLWQGEYFVDILEGTPYEQAALGTNKQNTILPAMRERINDTQGLDSIVSLELIEDRDTRSRTINAEINTLYGETEITGVL